MNAYYHYKYTNGRQFVSTASPIILTVYKEGSTDVYGVPYEKPKLIGIWRFKKLTNKNKSI